MGRRILFTSPAALGHVHPMVPLARAVATRGHDVLWALPAGGVGHVERAGIRAVTAGPGGTPSPGDTLRRYPELNALSPRDRGDVMFGKLFGAVTAPAMLDDMARVASEWRPDLVVADAAEFTGHIAAAELGVPSVTKGFGPILPRRRVAVAGDEVAPLWRSHGLEPRPYGGSYDHLYLDIYPPGMQPATPAHIPRLPQGADQFLNADAVASVGAGTSLMPDAADADAIRDAVSRLLSDASFRDAAGRLRASIASMPSPDDVAAVLEELL